jgi:tetratricopeptide (TPR) repeat protein
LTSGPERTQNYVIIPVVSLRVFTCLRVSVVAGVLLAAGSARAADSQPLQAAAHADAEAERHATLGQRLLARGQPQEAIAEFRRAYELRADPRFLFDIAEGYRQVGRVDQALFFYERYLSAAPDAPDRDEVEEQMSDLEKSRSRSPLASPPAIKSPPPSPAPASPFAHDVVLVPIAPAADATDEHPLWRRWWVWTAVGVLIAGGAVAAMTLDSSRTPVPATALGDKKFY